MRSNLSPRIAKESTCPRHPPYYPYGSIERSEPDNIRRLARSLSASPAKTSAPTPLSGSLHFVLMPNKRNQISNSSSSTLPSQSHLRATTLCSSKIRRRRSANIEWQKFFRGKHDAHKKIESPSTPTVLFADQNNQPHPPRRSALQSVIEAAENFTEQSVQLTLNHLHQPLQRKNN
jgi:hypothetical protein